LYKKKSCIFKK